jgi:hypothetical protein
VSRAEGACYGRRAGDDEPFEPLSDAVAFPRLEPDQSPYLELRVERQGPAWWVFFGGRRLGHFRDDGPPKLPEFRLVAEGGTAHFDAVEVAELGPADGP